MYIGRDKIGTYPLQIIIENINNEDEKKILFEGLKGNILEMSQVKFLLIKGCSSGTCNRKNSKDIF